MKGLQSDPLRTFAPKLYDALVYSTVSGIDCVHPMNRRAPVFNLTLHSLLFLWLFFGCLELVEQLQLVPETGVEDQTGQDQDEDALSELASGLRSDVPLLLTGDNNREPTISVSLTRVNQFTYPNPPPPSLPLYQQCSVYRI